MEIEVSRYGIAAERGACAFCESVAFVTIWTGKDLNVVRIDGKVVCGRCWVDRKEITQSVRDQVAMLAMALPSRDNG